MIQFIFVVLIIGLLWFFMGHKQQTEVKKELQQEIPSAAYVENLHSDVQRAQAAADIANKTIKQEEKDAKHGIKQMENQ